MIFNRSIASSLFVGLSIIIFLMTALLGYFLIKKEYLRMQQETSRIEEEHILTQQKLIRNEVLRVTGYIDFMRSQTEYRVQNEIREQIYAAHTLATNLFLLNKQRLPEKELKRLIIETIRPWRFNKGRGYFFMTDLNGVEQLFASRALRKVISSERWLSISGVKRTGASTLSCLATCRAKLAFL